MTEGRPPEGALEIMTRLDDVQTALTYLRRGDDAGWTVRYTGEIVRALDFDRDEDKLLGFDLLNEALIQIGEDKEAHSLLANLLKECPLAGGTNMLGFLERASKVFNSTRNYWATGRALCEIARLATHFFPENAEEKFALALLGILRFTKSSRSLELRRLFEYWAGYDPRAAARALDLQELRQDANSVRAIVLVARATEAVGKLGRLQTARDKILRNFAVCKDPFERAGILTELASLELDLGLQKEAGETMESALSAIAQIGGNEDPEWKLNVFGSGAVENSTRPAQATSARIRAAAAHVRIDASAGRRTLVEAWASLYGSGYWESGGLIKTLVKTQLSTNPQALAPLIRGTSSPVLRAELLIAAAREHLPENYAEAKREISEALSLHRIDYPPNND